MSRGYSPILGNTTTNTCVPRDHTGHERIVVKSKFRLPGPTPLPPAVIAAMQREMIPHRGPVLKALFRSIIERAKIVHQTDSDIIVLPGSGSAGWEIAVTNLFSPKDQVICLNGGDFADR